MQEELRMYDGSDEELYLCCYSGKKSYLDNLAAFAAFSPGYKTEWAVGMQTRLDKAEGILGQSARDSTAQIMRIDLAKAGVSGTALWQRLKRYTSKAFEAAGGDVIAVKWKEAGLEFYEKAANENWQSLISLMKAGVQFIDNNIGALKPGEIVPVDFKKEFEEAAVLCKNRFDEFVQLEEQGVVDTGEKVKANNACYSYLIEMFKDAQEIFAGPDDGGLRKQFVYSEVLLLVGGAGDAGVKGDVKDGAELPLAGVSVTTTKGGHSTVTDADGHFDLSLAAGSYVLLFKLAGKVDVSLNVEVETGVRKTVHVVMSAV